MCVFVFTAFQTYVIPNDLLLPYMALHGMFEFLDFLNVFSLMRHTFSSSHIICSRCAVCLLVLLLVIVDVFSPFIYIFWS